MMLSLGGQMDTMARPTGSEGRKRGRMRKWTWIGM